MKISILFVITLILGITTLGFSGKVNLDDKGATLNVKVRVQIGHELNRSKGVDPVVNSIALRRARISASGYLFKNVKYYFGLKGENLILGKPGFKKAYIKFTPSKALNITLGGFDVPFSREKSYNSSGKLLLVNRSNATNHNVVKLDIGIMLDGRVLSDQFYYGIALLNGAGGLEDGLNGWRGSFVKAKDGSASSSVGSSNIYFDVAARIQFDPFGVWKDGKEFFHRKMKLSIGGGVYYSIQRDVSSVLDGYEGTKDFIGLTADIGFNWNIIYLEGGFYYHNAKANSTYGSASAIESYVAYFAQAAVTILPKYLLASIRLDTYEENTGETIDDKIMEGTLGLSWYISGKQHALKFQTECTYQLDKAADASNSSNKEFIWKNQITLNF